MGNDKLAGIVQRSVWTFISLTPSNFFKENALRDAGATTECRTLNIER
jgi:hypothetical protein